MADGGDSPPDDDVQEPSDSERDASTTCFGRSSASSRASSSSSGRGRREPSKTRTPKEKRQTKRPRTFQTGDTPDAKQQWRERSVAQTAKPGSSYSQAEKEFVFRHVDEHGTNINWDILADTMNLEFNTSRTGKAIKTSHTRWMSLGPPRPTPPATGVQVQADAGGPTIGIQVQPETEAAWTQTPKPETEAAWTQTPKTARRTVAIQTVPSPYVPTVVPPGGEVIRIVLETPGATKRAVVHDADLQGFCKALVRGRTQKLEKKDKEVLARSFLKLEGMQEVIEDVTVQHLRKECESICSKKNPSTLRSHGAESLKNFKMAAVSEEWDGRCPLLKKVLCAATGKKKDEAIVPPGCMILFARNRELSAFAYITGLLLDNGGVTDKVITLLNRANMCMSTSSLLSKKAVLQKYHQARVRNLIR